jgi:hypothetical protein
MDFFQSRNIKNHMCLAQFSCTLYTDNQAVIRSLTNRTSGSGRYLVNALRLAANSSPGTIHIKWISGHSDVRGNEKADELANLAAPRGQGQSSPATDLPPLLRESLTVHHREANLHQRNRRHVERPVTGLTKTCTNGTIRQSLPLQEIQKATEQPHARPNQPTATAT